MGLFDPDNRFWSFVMGVGAVVLLVMLWYLVSLLFFTIGAATAALTHYCVNQARGLGSHVWSDLSGTFRTRFVRATLLWLMQFLLGAFLAFDAYVAWQMVMDLHGIGFQQFVFSVLICIMLIYVGTSVYLYPLLSFLDEGVRKVVKDSLMIFMRNLLATLKIVIIYLLAGAATFFIPAFFPLFFGMALYFSSPLLVTVLEREGVIEAL